MNKYIIFQFAFILLLVNVSYGQGFTNSGAVQNTNQPITITGNFTTPGISTTNSANSVTIAGMYFGNRNDVSVTAIGIGVLPGNSNAILPTRNTGLGVNALNSVTTGYFNVAVGNSVLMNATGIANTGIGNQAAQGGAGTCTGSNNVAMGNAALLQFRAANGNTAIGTNSLNSNLNSDNNTALGINALSLLQSGTRNVGLGANALSPGLISGSNNVGIGADVTLSNNTDNQLSIQNTIYGKNMTGTTTPGTGNVGIAVIPAIMPVSGRYAKLHVGSGTLMPSLQLDYVPGGSNSGNNYLYVDNEGMVMQGTPTSAIGVNTCNAAGNLPLVNNTGGAGNMGCSQVFDNGTLHGTVSIGNGGNANVSWTSGIAEELSSTGLNNAPSHYTPSTSFQLYANGWVGAIGYLATSDQTIKKNIKKIENPIDKIVRISGYTYDWNLDAKTNRKLDSNRQAGFLAQEILKVLPEAVVKCSDGLYSLNYNAVMPLLAEGIKEQQTQIKQQEIKLANQQTEINDLKNKINQLVPGNVIVKDDNFQITPNPVTGTSIVSYKMDASITNAVFIVYDLQGKMLKKYSVDTNAKQGHVQISKKDFVNGMYILSLVSNNQEIQSKHFIISE